MEFFMMTGVKFMDELTIPRRSVHHPQLPDNTEGTPYLFEHYAVSHYNHRLRYTSISQRIHHRG